MKFSSSILVSILSAVAHVNAGCTENGGNYYCSLTSKVIYKGVGFSGTYKDVTNMNEDTGSCTQKSRSFSGNLSPLDEQLSVHCRGPLKLKQFGVYYPSSLSSNKKREEDCNDNIHQHHKHKRATAVVEVTQTVVVDDSGNTVTSQATNTPTVSDASTTVTSSTAGSASSPNAASSGTSGTSSSDESESSSSSGSVDGSSAGSYERVSYYASGTSDNVTFLNYYGGSGSGTWSSKFGNSLSYANSDFSGGSSKAVTVDSVSIGSDVEYVIMSGDKCDDSCGYYRDGIPAYKGFAGKEKIFVFEFEMPEASGSSSTYNYDMPAIWLLNAKIPRTLQYGDSSCSCWETGCGELDLFEILSSGSDKLISHLHDGQGGGSSGYGGGGSQDYFKRPTSGTIKAAVVFDGENIHILTVDDDFGETLDSSTVQAWIDKEGSIAQINS
ncbi:uncharacterized protein PRCAT00001960001 [Priceomyces carsonii]|uniref:uncharacterized protein n=1 Tax=Priceomyces carsonii TaxID=28549 RepID=UPI002EDB3590|nr:unnamed protein product [Priceomyces carsonii]